MSATTSLLFALSAWAGGGPANVLVVYNGDEPGALAIAERYATLRSLPNGALCPVGGIDPGANAIDFADYDALIRPAVRACLDALPRAEEIDYLVLVRGLPYRVDITDGYATSLDAMLQVWDAEDGRGQAIAGSPQATSQGLWVASVDNPVYADGRARIADFTLENPYSSWYVAASGLSRQVEWPGSFRRAEVGTLAGVDWDDNLFVVSRLDGFDDADALALAERGAAADGSFPAGTWLCMESADSARGARDPECELTMRLLASAGFDAEYLSPHDPALAGRQLVAYFTGAAELRGAIDGNTFPPGALVENLTSYGAVPENFRCSADGALCPEAESQTSIARFVRAGATGVHGTVAEPLNNCFPNAGALLLYAMGYNLGESLLFNQRSLYWQNIVLGDPLATPWDERPVVELPTEARVGEGLRVHATHARGVALLRLYRDGVLVAEEDGDTLDWFAEGEVGEILNLLAVAIAEDPLLEVPDWPETSIALHPAVQGWAAAALPLDEAEHQDTGIAPDEKACGCSQSADPQALLALLALFAARRRG